MFPKIIQNITRQFINIHLINQIWRKIILIKAYHGDNTMHEQFYMCDSHKREMSFSAQSNCKEMLAIVFGTYHDMFKNVSR